jgi:hypothetical protein
MQPTSVVMHGEKLPLLESTLHGTSSQQLRDLGLFVEDVRRKWQSQHEGGNGK